MISQCTYREFAPNAAVRKVPVPIGRECQQETAGIQHYHLQQCCQLRCDGEQGLFHIVTVMS